MYKRLLKSEQDLLCWKDSENFQSSRFVQDQLNKLPEPEVYPVVLIWDWNCDDQSRDWLSYEYVYVADFEN